MCIESRDVYANKTPEGKQGSNDRGRNKQMLDQKQWEKINDIIASIHATKNTTARGQLSQKLMGVVSFDFFGFNIGMMQNMPILFSGSVVVSKLIKKLRRLYLSV